MKKSLPIVAVFLVGCGGSFRLLATTPKGGEIALDGSRESAMAKAREEFAKKCGGDKSYEIVEEGEASTFDKPAGGVKDPHEWRVRYECKGP
jgi:hypothetical protein